MSSDQRHYNPVNSQSPSGSMTNLINASTGTLATPNVRPRYPGTPSSPVHGAFVSAPSPRDSQSSSYLIRDPRQDSYDTRGSTGSLSSKFLLSPNPALWGINNEPEDDDILHNPDPRRDKKFDSAGTICTTRGFVNIGCLSLVLICIIGLFAGYPISSWAVDKFSTSRHTSTQPTVASITNFPDLIDSDTPDYAKTRTSFNDGSSTEYTLVFSDEFNTDGRTFYPGDDPYWEAVNFNYWATGDLEWYDPSAVTTSNGSLVISLTDTTNHDLDYMSGMLQSWNKFCFTGGIVEVSVMLPGANDVMGLWPAIWTMGNLGRAGYGATTDGLWPYTYDSCDVGTVANQTKDGAPTAATINGDPSHGGVLSYLGGQRLSRCTCPGQSHPGPVHDDGTYVGRAAPEIDIFEAQVSGVIGYVSQSGQFAPFNYEYVWDNTTGNYNITNSTATTLNSYLGGIYQQAVSAVTLTEQDCYQLSGGCFSVYAIEYEPGFDDAYITWVTANKSAWTLLASGVGADTETEISARPIPQEPMYIIMNLGLSTSFSTIDFGALTFPATMMVDYVRVYQKSDSINIGCDPEDFPTADYINTYSEIYYDPNITTWVDGYGQTQPTNSFLDQC